MYIILTLAQSCLYSPLLGRQNQKDHEFEDSLGYISETCLININKNFGG